MMIKRILTICAAVAACAAGTSLAHAQQGYPVPPGSVYSTPPGPIRPAATSSMIAVAPARRISTRWKMTRRRTRQSSTALPPPGPVLSPNDPRYGRPMGAPVYSDRAPMPTGPVLSPDDPRYGRPDRSAAGDLFRPCRADRSAAYSPR